MFNIQASGFSNIIILLEGKTHFKLTHKRDVTKKLEVKKLKVQEDSTITALFLRDIIDKRYQPSTLL